MTGPRVRPGNGLLHPVALVALATLVLNDWLLKAAWPGLATGKLSDVAGLIVAPLAVEATWEVGEWLTGRWRGPSVRVLLVAIVVTAAAFAAIQVVPAAVDAYRWGLGLLQWPLRAVAAGLAGASPPAIMPVVATPDVEDLVALPTVALTWWLGRRRVRAWAPASRMASGGTT